MNHYPRHVGDITRDTFGLSLTEFGAYDRLLDALTKCGYLRDDSLAYMRELLVTTDNDRLGHVRVMVRPEPTMPEAA